MNSFRASKFDFKIFFAECLFFDTRQRRSLPSVKRIHSAKKLFAECQKNTLGKESSLLSVKKTLGKEGLCRVFFYTRQRSLCRVFFLTLSKELFCRVPKNKHSAKYLTLGKDADSGSDQFVRLQLYEINHSYANSVAFFFVLACVFLIRKQGLAFWARPTVQRRSIT